MAASSSPYFYPRPPRGGRPTTWTTRPRHRKFLSTPSARRATSFAYAGKLLFPISIHALREEGDGKAAGWPQAQPYFYPRPPRGGRQGRAQCRCPLSPISIHALREEGDRKPGRFYQALQTISIHALREEGDWRGTKSLLSLSAFLSTPSARRATKRGHTDKTYKCISIHALREEGDAASVPQPPDCCKFLSTPSARRATPHS